MITRGLGQHSESLLITRGLGMPLCFTYVSGDGTILSMYPYNENIYNVKPSNEQPVRQYPCNENIYDIKPLNEEINKISNKKEQSYQIDVCGE